MMTLPFEKRFWQLFGVNAPSWAHERPDRCEYRDEWRPDHRADELSERFQEDHGAWDESERAA